MLHSTLILNADGQPLSMLPLSSKPWQDAIGMIWTGAAEPLHNYEHWTVHSPSIAMPVPAVCILKQKVRIKRVELNEGGHPVPRLVFLRDGFRCQYCRKQFPKRQLTLDHVIPRTFGGRSRWDNLSSACEPCNSNRGHNTKIQPANKPFRPTYDHLLKQVRKFPVNIPHPTWNYYLGWPTDMVRLIDPKANEIDFIYHDDFDFVSTGSVSSAGI